MAFEWLLDNIARVAELSKELKLPIYIDLFPPVPEPVIDAWEQVIGLPLPPSYRDFLRITNGLTIDYRCVLSNEGDDFYRVGNQIFILQIEHIYNISQYYKSLCDNASENMLEHWQTLLVCAAIAGGGDYIVFDPEQTSHDGEYKVCFAAHEEWPGNWRRDLILSSSFEKWLKNIFDGILNRQVYPEYWRGAFSTSPKSGDSLLPPGADKYDWTCTSEVVAGKAVPIEADCRFPESASGYLGIVPPTYTGASAGARIAYTLIGHRVFLTESPKSKELEDYPSVAWCRLSRCR